MDRPEVTIAVPLYNGAKTVEETIRSVLAQSYDRFELVVLDDGSTDDSLDVVASIDDPRLRVLRFDNEGLGASFNRCIDHSRGRFLKVLPQDDLLHPDCLSVSMELLARAENPTLLFSRREIEWDRADAWSARWMSNYETLDTYLQPLDDVNDGQEVLRRWAAAGKLKRNCVAEPLATIFPVALAREIGGFSKIMIQNVDFLLWMRLMARGELCFTARKLGTFRLHKENTSRINKLGNKLTFENLLLLHELAADSEMLRLLPKIPMLLEAEQRKVFGLGIRRLLFWKRYPSLDELPPVPPAAVD